MRIRIRKNAFKTLSKTCVNPIVTRVWTCYDDLVNAYINLKGVMILFLKRLQLFLLTCICILMYTSFQAEAIFAKSKVNIGAIPADQQVSSQIHDTSTKRQAIILTATDLIGTPYVWGGNDLSGFDCSGFIEYIFKKNGLYMPRTTNQQQYFGESITFDQVRPGDLYFFEEDGQVYHVALALADGYYLHAPSPGKDVTYGHVDRFAPQFANRVMLN